MTTADPGTAVAGWEDGRRPLLQGQVSMANAALVRAGGEALVAARNPDTGGNGRLCISLDELTSANSVTVAVLTSLVRIADRHGVDLTWQGFSGDLAAIITFSGLDEVFGLDQGSEQSPEPQQEQT